MSMNGVERVRSACKEKGIPISKLERDLGFANGYLNPKKLKSIPYERAILIANYLDVSLNTVLGVPEPADYFLDEDAAAIAQEIQANKDIRIIFDGVRKASKEDMLFIKDLVERMGLNNDQN